jgi:hypothetical protein
MNIRIHSNLLQIAASAISAYLLPSTERQASIDFVEQDMRKDWQESITAGAKEDARIVIDLFQNASGRFTTLDEAQAHASVRTLSRIRLYLSENELGDIDISNLANEFESALMQKNVPIIQGLQVYSLLSSIESEILGQLIDVELTPEDLADDDN